MHVDEAKYVNDELFSDIRKNFSSKVAPSRQPIHDLVDKSKELRVLDGKAAQNFGKAIFRIRKQEQQRFFFSNYVQSTESTTTDFS